MHGIGLGQSDFRALRIRKNYYIDKTMYIKDIIDNDSSVILVTRPRRFGKTLNMSMLRYYFDCSQKDNKELFEGLKIMEQGEEYTSKLGYYPCIYLTLKDLVTLKLDEFEQKFKVLVRQMFSFMDVRENTAENFYHAFVLGMLVGLKDSYYVNSNRESGYGRYDIMLEPKDKNGNSFIMEFKVYREEKEKDINDTIESAKKQIEERKYEENLQEKGFTNITKIVFAFKGKEVKMQVV